MTIKIISLIIVAIIVVYFLRKEKTKSDEYFGKPKKYNKNELAILDHYKSIYKPIPDDKRFPNLQRDGFELEDILLTATQIVFDNPIPKTEEIERIRKGDLVKLLFTDNDGYVERMWVEVVEHNNQFIKGLLRNDAIEFDDLKDGSVIHFHSNHIYEIDKDSIS
jgi:hypothetical protein